MAREYTHEEHIAWLKSLHGNPSGVAVLLETADKKLLIVKANYKKYWTLPGGVIDKGESPLRAAVREVKEEVGLVIDPSQIQFVRVIYRGGKEVDTYQFVFRTIISQKLARSVVLQASEIEAYALETAEQIKQTKRLYAPTVMAWCNNDSVVGYREEKLVTPAEDQV